MRASLKKLKGKLDDLDKARKAEVLTKVSLSVYILPVLSQFNLLFKRFAHRPSSVNKVQL